jgi:DNA-directed RNA polymerase subunit RPC12/RpoP
MKQGYEEGLETFLTEAKQAYARMFGPELQAELKTFSQREVCVYEEGRRLSRALLEAHLARDKDSRPAADKTVPCPRCQHPSRQVKGSSLELRPVTTLVGEVAYPRAKYRCAHCRKIFSLGSNPATEFIATQSRGA